MPIVMYKVYDLPNTLPDDIKAIYISLIEDFRSRVRDDIPKDNILYEKAYRYKDRQIMKFIDNAIKDINSYSTIKTQFDLIYYNSIDANMLLEGAIVMMLRGEGILQTANQIDYNDSGLSIGMYNKGPQYQSWWGNILVSYELSKKNFKDGVIARSPNAGFVGIASEYSYRFGGRYGL
jgi:hypothetical protein